MIEKPKRLSPLNTIRNQLNKLPIYRQLRTLQKDAFDALNNERLQALFFGIGAQKGGTTALYSYLAKHPELEATSVKELDYFYCDKRWARGKGRYLRELPLNKSKKDRLWTYDISPHYMFGGEIVAKRIKELYPEAKIIALLRNPVDRAYSAWNMYLSHQAMDPDWYVAMYGKCKGAKQVEALHRRSRTFGQDFLADCNEELVQLEAGRRVEMPIVEFGFYKAQLAGYYQHFSSQNILILESEKFLAHRALTLARIERFLNLSAHEWAHTNLAPIYEGAYRRHVPREAKSVLTALYASENKGLSELTGRTFSWT